MGESSVAFVTLVLFLAGVFPALAAWKRLPIFEILPAIVLSYVAATTIAVAGGWPTGAEVDGTRSLIMRHLLPALVFLLLVRCDLRAVAALGPRVLVAFACATASILAGFVIAWILWRPFLPATGWQVLASVGAGWVGGSANLVAVSRAIGAAPETMSLALVTDAAGYALWVFLLFGTVPLSERFNRWAGATPAAAPPPAPVAPPIGTTPGSVLLWLAAGLAGAAAAQLIAVRLPSAGVLNETSWSLLVASLLGLAASFTPLSRLPGAEATGSALLAIVVVALGSQGSFAGLATAPACVLAGLTALAVHAAAMVCAARVFRLDLALCGIASLANIGGIASAPVLAAAHRPALAPVGVLLALVGYLVGTGAGLALAWLLPRLGSGLIVGLLLTLQFAGTPPRAMGDERGGADHWIARCPDADRVLLGSDEIATLNRRLLATDRSVHDLDLLPDALPGGEVAALVARVSRLPDEPLVLEGGRRATAADRERWLGSLVRDAIPDRVGPRFALVTRRAALRRFPTWESVSRPGGAGDIDLFQESAFFPGTTVAAVHATADGQWTFAIGTTYAAWIETAALAFGPRDAVLDYARRSRWVVTAATATARPLPGPSTPAEVSLDMGTAFPEAVGHAAGMVDLPVAGPDGTLAFAPAVVAPADALHAGPLPASRANVLRQAFRFLGERYGWGHSHGARDCSGLVCEVYRSLGILLPRNTRDQAASPAFERVALGPEVAPDGRLDAIGRLRAGDLVYAPRHVMMVVGHDESGPWVIHDTHRGRVAGDPPQAVADGVVIAPLARILAEDGRLIIDSVTTLVRVFPPRLDDRPSGDRS